jgi:serine/threonine protein kinase
MGNKFRGGAGSNRAKGAGSSEDKTVMAFVGQPAKPQDDEKTVMANVSSPPPLPPKPAAPQDDEKTVMANVSPALPAKPAGATDAQDEKTIMAGPPPVPPASQPADDDKTVMAHVPSPSKPAPADDDKTVMAHVPSPSKPEDKPAFEAKEVDEGEQTIVVDPSLFAPVGPTRDAAKGQVNIGKAPAKQEPKKGEAKPKAQSKPENTGVTSNQTDAFFSNSNTTNTSNTSQHTQNTGSTGDSGGSTGGGHGGGSGEMPVPGQRMNQYEIIRLLGEGGMGSVFLARDTKLGRRVAIKVLHTTDPAVTQRFIVEARATARVEHENIVSIYEVGEWQGNPFMVLQFLQGQELTKLIPRGKRMPIPRVVEIMTPVLRALSYAHGEGIVHRDLKPDNIFVTDGGVTKVLDFGIAKVVQGEDKTTDGEGPRKLTAEELQGLGGGKEMTRHGAIMGTMPYMSPEQWGNGVTIDHTSDIWAVGIMMYKMLSGEHPLAPLSGMELMVTAFLDEPTPSLKEKAPDLPREIIEVVDKCLVKDKANRWADALALLRALEPFQPGRFSANRTEHVETSPYAGLSAFQEQDANRFFGRKREIAAMAQRLRDRPIMAVVGPSGVGKSSLVRAGLVPAMRNSGESWDISVIRPGRTPLKSLASLLSQTVGTSTNLAEEISETEKVAERLLTEPGYLGTALRRQARKEKKNLLVFVDQFEELYTLVQDPAERLAFTACLSAAADDSTSPMRVIISIRSDFLDRCVEDQHFMTELSQGLFFISSPSRDGMRDAIVLPAEMAGYKFESETIIDEMLDHLAQTSGALPLLQFTADRLWTERDPSKRLLSLASYRALGGIAGALAAHADRVLEQVSAEQRTLARALLLNLVTPDRTRAIVSIDELRDQLGKSGDIQALIDQFVAARLLTVQTGGGGSGATVELVHESLIHTWPQLARWLDEGHEDAAFLEQLRNASRQWAAKDKDAGLLWRGEMAEESKRFVRRFRGELSETQQQFLKAVIDMSMRAARIKKIAYITAAIVLVGMLAAAAVALVVINESRGDAQRQAQAAKIAEKKASEAAEEAKKQESIAVGMLNEVKAAEAAREKALKEAKDAEVAAKESEAVAKTAEAKAKASAAEAEAQAEIAKKEKEKAEALRQVAETEKVKAAEQARAAEVARQNAEAQRRMAEDEKRKADAARADAVKQREEAEVQKKKAEAAEAEAIRKLKVATGGGIAEKLK